MHHNNYVTAVQECVCLLPSTNRLFLFSGAGESGKSTIVKQMKILHIQGGFPEAYVLTNTVLIVVEVSAGVLAKISTSHLITV